MISMLKTLQKLLFGFFIVIISCQLTEAQYHVTNNANGIAAPGNAWDSPGCGGSGSTFPTGTFVEGLRQLNAISATSLVIDAGVGNIDLSARNSDNTILCVNGVTITGNGTATIISTLGYGDVLKINGNNNTFSNLKFSGHVTVSGTGNIFQNCTFSCSNTLGAITLSAGGNTIQASTFNISGSSSTQGSVVISGGSGNEIKTSTFNVTGNIDAIQINGSATNTKVTSNTITGATGVTGVGVLVTTSGTRIDGNTISSFETGVSSQASTSTTIVNNYIFGNANYGIRAGAKGTPGTGPISNFLVIQGNKIGINSSDQVKSHKEEGIYIDGGNGHIIGGNASQSNIVVGSGFGNVDQDYGNGIAIWNCNGSGANAVSIQGNFIGTKSGSEVKDSGGKYFGNSRNGIYIRSSSNVLIGGSFPNIIGNNGFGIANYPQSGIALYVNSSNVNIKGNYIGTDNKGLNTSSKIGNSQEGVTINTSNSNTVDGNVICNNSNGIGIRSNGCTGSNFNIIKSNLIGIDQFNSTLISLANYSIGISIEFCSHDNTIGGATTAEGNTIQATGQNFKFNTGNDPIAPTTAGSGYGVWIVINSNNNKLYNNKIGRLSTDNVALSNTGDGIHIEQGSSNNFIGDINGGKSNIIALNGGDGIEIDGKITANTTVSSANNFISRNSINSNVGMGIKLTNGGNGGQAGAIVSGVIGTTVSGTAALGARVEVFTDNSGRACTDALKKQGSTYLGFTTASAIDGTWSFTDPSITSANASATATSGSNTSEFNTCVQCLPPTVKNPTLTVCENSSVVYTTSGVSNPIWTVTGATFTGQGTQSITVTFGTTSPVSIKVDDGVSCLGTPISVTVNPNPSIAVAGTDKAVCGSSTTLSATTPTVGQGTWTAPGSVTFADIHNPTTTVSNLPLGVTTLTWTVANSPCAASSATVKIDSKANPSAANAGADKAVCGATASLNATTPTVGTGTWTSSASVTFTDINNPTTTVSGLPLGVTTLTWTVANSPCTPSVATVKIDSKATPSVANAGADKAVCGATASLNATAPTVGTGTWTSSASVTFGDINNPTTTVSGLPLGITTLTWTVANSPCTPSVATVKIDSKATPSVANAGADKAVCGATASLNATAPSVGTGTWTSSASVTFTDINNPTTTVSGLPLGVTTLTWTVANSPCTASVATVKIDSKATPSVANAGADKAVCGASAALNATAPTVGTGTWTSTSTATFVDANDPTTTVNNLPVGTTTLTWTVANSPCTASVATVKIDSKATPSGANAGADKATCGATATLEATAPTVGTGTWTSSGSVTFADINNPTTTVSNLPLGPTTLTWTVANSPCTPSVATVVINSKGSPSAANAGSDNAVCGSSANLNATAPTVGVGTWTSTSSVTFVDINDPATTVNNLPLGKTTFTWTVANSPCTPSVATVVIDSKEIPSAANAGADKAICNSTSTTLDATAPTVGTGTWSSSSAVTFVDVNDPKTTVNNLSLATSTTLIWTVTNSPCSPSVAQVVIDNNEQPSDPDAGTLSPVCSGVDIQLNAIAPAIGQGVWTADNTVTFTPDNKTENATVSGLPVGNTTFTWTITNGVCPAKDAKVSIRVDKAPTAPVASGDSTICDNFTGILPLSATATIGTNEKIVWYQGTCGGAANKISEALSFDITTAPTVTTTYFVRLEGNACGNTACDDVTITVNPKPTDPTDATVNRNDFCPEDQGDIVLTAVDGSGQEAVWYAQFGNKVCGDGIRVGTGSPLTISSPSDTTVYFVRFETKGCAASLCKQVKVNVSTFFVEAGGIIDSLIPLCRFSGIDKLGKDSIHVNSFIFPPTNNFHWEQVLNPNPDSTRALDLMFTDADTDPAQAGIQLPLQPTINTTVPGGPFKYYLIVDNGACKPVKDSVYIRIHPLPTVSLVSDNDTVCVGTPINLTATASVAKPLAYAWTTSDESFVDTIKFKKFADIVNPFVLSQTPTAHDELIYYVTVVDSNGCWSDSAKVALTIRDNQKLNIPNLITPNDDNKNDCWLITDENGFDILPGAKFQVFNRWGQQVYKNDQYKNGDFCGSVLADGIYFYYIKPGCGPKEEKGWLQIISNTESSNK